MVFRDSISISSLFTVPGERDHVCEICGSSYFSKKGLRKHERAAHPTLKPMRPKPFKINEDGSKGAVNCKPSRPEAGAEPVQQPQQSGDDPDHNGGRGVAQISSMYMAAMVQQRPHDQRLSLFNPIMKI